MTELGYESLFYGVWPSLSHWMTSTTRPACEINLLRWRKTIKLSPDVIFHTGNVEIIFRLCFTLPHFAANLSFTINFCEWTLSLKNFLHRLPCCLCLQQFFSRLFTHFHHQKWAKRERKILSEQFQVDVNAENYFAIKKHFKAIIAISVTLILQSFSKERKMESWKFFSVLSRFSTRLCLHQKNEIPGARYLIE